MDHFDTILEKSLRKFDSELLARYGLSREATKAQIDRLMQDLESEERHRPYISSAFLEHETLQGVIDSVSIDWPTIQRKAEDALISRGSLRGDHFHESGAAQCGP